MTSAEIEKIMTEMGCNKAETAAALGISKTTFQRYTDSTAAMPAPLAARLIELHRGVTDFMAKFPAKFGKRLDLQYPNGIQGGL